MTSIYINDAYIARVDLEPSEVIKRMKDDKPHVKVLKQNAQNVWFRDEKAGFGKTEKQLEIRPQLERLRHILDEKRSDIADIIGAILRGEQWKDSAVEERYIQTTIKTPKGDVIDIEYDTLTTLMQYRFPNDSEDEEDEHWMTADCKYIDL